MRQLITGMVAAVAVMAAAPAMACGYNPCGAPVYVAPAPVVSYGCNPCGGGYSGGWATERLAAPEQQYYYVNQGPTYTGPGSYAPARVYEEGSVSGGYGYARPYYGYRHHHHYGYGGYRQHYGYRAHYGYRHYRPYAPRLSYYPSPRMGYHHGYSPYRRGYPVLRRYY
jgi:hypothetical protein